MKNPSQDSNIILMCIYYYIDEQTQNYYSYIGPAEKVYDKKTKTISYQCIRKPEKNFDKWILYDIFYAIDPQTRPIPNGMKLFCIKKRMSFPYDITDIHIVYDTFDIEPNCNYFITYNMPAINTKMLHFFKIGQNIFPTFNRFPPNFNPDWQYYTTVHLMTRETIGNIFNENISQLKFNCVNGRCIPWTTDIDDIYRQKSSFEPTNFQDCVLKCNQINIDNKQRNLINDILNESIIKPQQFSFTEETKITNDNGTVTTTTKSSGSSSFYTWYVIIFFLVLGIISMVIVFWLFKITHKSELSKKNNKNAVYRV